MYPHEMNRKRAGCFLFLLRILGYGVSIKLNVNNDKSTTYLRSRNQNSRFFSWLRFGYSICPIFDFQWGIHLSWYNKKISPKLLTLRILSSTFLFQSFFVSGADGARTRARLAPARVFREITLPSPTLPGGNWGRGVFAVRVFKLVHKKKPRTFPELSCGADGARTRDPRRDRPVF